MPSDRCATTTSDCSTRTTEYTEVGLTVPSGTTAALFVRVVWQVGVLRLAVCLRRQHLEQSLGNPSQGTSATHWQPTTHRQPPNDHRSLQQRRARCRARFASTAGPSMPGSL